MRSEKSLRQVGLVSLLSLVCGLASCADSPRQGKDERDGEGPSFTASNYAIRTFWEFNGKTKQVNIPPALVGSKHASGTLAPTLKTTANADLDKILDPVPESQDGRVLLWLAAMQCGVPYKGDTGIDANPFLAEISATRPWGVPNGFYVFSQPPSSCDQALVYEETMLCMANQLNEVAKAVDNVFWKIPLEEGLTIRIPPQASKDRFIVRDLARNALAHLGYLDALSMAPLAPSTGLSCSSAYQTLLQTPSSFSNPATNSQKIFGVAAGAPTKYIAPDSEATQANLPSLLDGRLRFQTNTLRAAANLLHDIVHDSVYEDLAGAESTRSKATDPLEGNRRAWGLDQPGPWNNPALTELYSPSYNSLEHAVQVVAGRLEVGTNPNVNSQDDPELGDPRCGGLRSSELLRRGFGPEMTARAHDVGVSTKGQSNALVMVAKAGLVIPPAHYGTNEEVLASSVKSLVLSYLKAVTAWERKFVTPQNTPDLQAFEDSGQAEELEASFSSLKDGDIRFALHRLYDLWRLHTSSADGATPAGDVAGLKVWPFPSPTPVSFSFSAFSNLEPDDIAIDIMARVGGIQEASQCPGNPSPPAGAWSRTHSDRQHQEIFQDSFALAQHFGRRLTYTREVAKNAGISVQTAVTAAAGAAEIRTWAGPGQFRLVRRNSTQADLFGIGFEPSDLGVNSFDELSKQIVLVYGDPWVAECVAGLRKTCPDNVESYVVTASEVSLNSATTSLPRLQGTDYGAFNMRFFAAGPMYHTTGQIAPNQHAYIVQRHDATNPSGGGRVLGALALRRSSDVPGADPITSLTVSNMQRQMFNDILGVPKKWNFFGSSVGFTTLSNGRSYCIDGVSWDQFVPLENELTSDSDQYENSWRHYLNLAKIAADETDRLGNELIQIGLQQELRREAALEAVGDLCGTYSEGAKTTIDKGKVVPSAENAKILACSDSPRKDVVIFAKPPEGKDLNAAFAREVLDCPTTPGTSTNPKCKIDRDPPLAMASLELTEPDFIQTNLLNKTCLNLASGVESLRSGYKGEILKGLKQGGQKWLNADAMGQLMSSVRLVVEQDGNWHLDVNQLPIMSSKAENQLWPGCLREGGDCTKSAEQTVFFSRVFQQANVRTSATCFSDSERKIGTDTCVPLVSTVDLFSLRWRVESALWMLANFAGSMPAKTISGYFPAAVLKLNGAPAPEWQAASAPTPAIYGDGAYANATWEFNNDLVKLDPDSNNEAQANAMPDLKAITASIWVGPNHGGEGEVPEWLRAVSPSGYQLVYASNPHFALTPGPYDIPAALDSFSEFSGARCATNSGAPRFVGAPAENTAKMAAWTLRAQNAAHLKGGRMNYIAGKDYIPWQICPTFYADRGWSGQVPEANWQIIFADFFTSANPPNFPQNVFTPGSVPFIYTVDLKHPAPLKFANVGFGGGTADIKDLGYFSAQNVSWQGNFTDFRSLAGDPNWLLKDPACLFQKPNAVHEVGTSQHDCLGDKYKEESGAGQPYTWYHAPRYMLSPSVCSPGSRIPLFTNSYPPPGICGAAAQVTQAFALACSIQENGVVGRLTDAPEIADAASISKLRYWADHQAEQLQLIVGRLYIEDIPERVWADIVGNNVSAGEAGGHQRDLEQSLTKALRDIPGAWNSLSTTIKQISNTISITEKKLDINKIDADIQKKEMWIRELSLVKDALSSIQKVADGASPGSWASAGATANIQTANLIATGLQMNAVKQIEALQAQKTQDVDLLALFELNGQMIQFVDTLDKQLRTLQGHVSDVISLSGQLRENEQKAAYHLGKATGAPYVLDKDGKPIVYPVNQVLQNQYDATRQRYERSLKNARYLSFMARRAIEQRVGKPLSAFKENMGPLPPPYEWADDVCYLQGIDYEVLSHVDVPGEAGAGGTGGSTGSETNSKAKVPAEFADQFIGDYVRKLEYFVEYYNIKYPSHDGDDQVVLSLRDDLLKRPAQCSVDGPNRLYFSEHLDKSAELSTENGEPITIGWTTTPCLSSQAKCLSAYPATNLLSTADKASPEIVSLFERATWLVDSGPPVQAPGLPPGGSELDQALQSNPASVYQKIYLEAGAYVLSWYDQARFSSGAPYPDNGSAIPLRGAPAKEYRVGVFAESGASKLSSLVLPYRHKVLPPPLGSAINTNPFWSPRHEEALKIEVPGYYYVLFGASGTGEQARGSVLIRDVQLEVSPTEKATPYVTTSSTRTIVTDKCPQLGAGDVQQAFTHTCDDAGHCYYELINPILISTTNLAGSNSALQGKLAAGNFNYRHVTVAMNLAGTALVDCSKDGSQSCYGSGYIEYTLDHDAFLVDVLGYDSNAAPFNFGSAGINHGKALAAERYITIPLSSADAGLLAQPSIEKPEFRGRPLDGSYRLRIWDRPGLTWSHLEDVQLILRYRYWSNILGQPGPN